jgi:hypothetical protein
MKPMAGNITLQEFTASSGTYTAGTTMATNQNASAAVTLEWREIR